MSYKHKFEQVDGETYQITMDSSVQWLQAGLHLVIPCREGRAPVFADSESNLVTLDNVHVRNSYAAAFQSWGGRLLTLTNCKATPMPGLYLSSNADFCIGGAYLSHCYSDAPGDDCFNTHIPGMIISSIDDNKVYHPRYKTPVVGDYATIYNTTTGQLCGIGESANNSSWIQDKPGSTLKESLPQGIATRKNGIRKDDFLGNSVWKGLIRYTDTVSRIFYPHHKFSIPVVFDCTFRNTRSGIVIMSPAGLVEGNTFENLPMGTGIIVGSIIGVGEGPVPYSVTVRNNIVRNAWTGLKSHVLCQPSIQPGPTVAIQGILFENNQIFDTVNPLWFNNLGKSEIKNVSITGKSEYADRFKEQSNKLRIARSDSVQLSGITLQGKPVTGQNFETAHALNIKIQ